MSNTNQSPASRAYALVRDYGINRATMIAEAEQDAEVVRILAEQFARAYELQHGGAK